MNAQEKWHGIQQRAATPGSRILNEFVARQQLARQIKNSADPTVMHDSISLSSREAVAVFSAGSGSASGEPVTPDTAMLVSAVYRCVSLISSGIAALPLHVYKRTAAGHPERVHDMDLWELLNLEPTARYSASEHWEKKGTEILLRGDSFTYIHRSRSGKPLELIPLPWSAVSVRRDTEEWPGRLKYYISDVRTFGADQDDMLHFSNFGFNGVRSPSTLQFGARNAVGNALAMDKYSGTFFANGAHPSIVLSTEKKMGPELIKETRDQFVERYSGSHNANKLPLILTEGLKADRLSLSAEDAQLLEARKFQVSDVGRAFGVPSSMLNEMSGSSNWGTGLEQQNKGLVIWTLNPYLKRFEQQATRKLGGNGLFFRFNRDALMEGDSKSQSEFWRKGLGGPGNGPGWMTVNEVRKLQNLPPVDEPWANQVFNPQTTDGAAAGQNALREERQDEENT